MARETPDARGGCGEQGQVKSSQAKWEWAEVESTCLAIRQSASTGRGWMGWDGERRRLRLWYLAFLSVEEKKRRRE